jgi:competence ComEA-like helix-hairpin-helix protein
MKPERRAIILLLGLAVGGQGLRVWLAAPGTPPGQVSLIPAPGGGTPLAHRDSGLALARPLAPGEKIDVDRASALEIARLPRVGLKLAKVIVSDRNSRGPFGRLEVLDRVPGIGPGLLATIRDQVRFSAVTVSPQPAADPSGALRSTISDPGNGERGTGNILPIISLNTATAAELERLPRVGPALAARIVAFRQKHGPFPVVDSLVRVPGIGPATLALLRDRLSAH